ncbi:hypothetical protein AVEN_174364-1 [Araneus ventricosus]|uniref:Uncharacterized protein n=1 Tax=Araneus ventricosus TaxID=182803 RepID=A0A4Y2TBW0_ARAVE|nr:hypothetical protein AVEN_12244-1 [Araneus ventricosus]GBN96889.1 hypothetical protein AVEN_174364-1 [Araneus ventricosus]
MGTTWERLQTGGLFLLEARRAALSRHDLSTVSRGCCHKMGGRKVPESSRGSLCSKRRGTGSSELYSPCFSNTGKQRKELLRTKLGEKNCSRISL